MFTRTDVKLEFHSLFQHVLFPHPILAVGKGQTALSYEELDL